MVDGKKGVEGGTLSGPCALLEPGWEAAMIRSGQRTDRQGAKVTSGNSNQANTPKRRVERPQERHDGPAHASRFPTRHDRAVFSDAQISFRGCPCSSSHIRAQTHRTISDLPGRRDVFYSKLTRNNFELETTSGARSRPSRYVDMLVRYLAADLP
jgi:hypothetical protein